VINEYRQANLPSNIIVRTTNYRHVCWLVPWLHIEASVYEDTINRPSWSRVTVLSTVQFIRRDAAQIGLQRDSVDDCCIVSSN